VTTDTNWDDPDVQEEVAAGVTDAESTAPTQQDEANSGVPVEETAPDAVPAGQPTANAARQGPPEASFSLAEGPASAFTVYGLTFQTGQATAVPPNLVGPVQTAARLAGVELTKES
jgi:hypothetical protein